MFGKSSQLESVDFQVTYLEEKKDSFYYQPGSGQGTNFLPSAKITQHKIFKEKSEDNNQVIKDLIQGIAEPQ